MSKPDYPIFDLSSPAFIEYLAGLPRHGYPPQLTWEALLLLRRDHPEFLDWQENWSLITHNQARAAALWTSSPDEKVQA